MLSGQISFNFCKFLQTCQSSFENIPQFRSWEQFLSLRHAEKPLSFSYEFGGSGGNLYEDCVFLRCYAMIVQIILRSLYTERHQVFCHKFMHITYYFSDTSRKCSSVKSDVGSITVVGTVYIGNVLAT